MTAPLIGSRLRLARERLHLTQVQVSQRTDIGGSSLSEFELGRREPSVAQLQTLAELYQRSLAWLLGEEPDVQEVVLWRERPAAPVAAEIGARFIRLSEQYRNLEAWCGEVDDCDLPWASDTRPEKFRSVDAASLAKRVRNELALGDRPGEGLLRTLEEACGVKVFHLAFEPSGTAACARSQAFGASILLNKNNVPWRRTFDIAHELFHLLTWEAFSSGWTGETLVATDREETLANVFASNLVMPEEPFRIAVQRRTGEASLPPLDKAYDVAREFGVSVEAVLTRAGILFNVPKERTSQARDAWRAVAILYEDRSREDDAPELPERYQALALTALRKGDVSIGRFAEYTGVSRQKALEISRKQETHGGETPTPAPA